MKQILVASIIFTLLSSSFFCKAQQSDVVFEQITNESGRSLGFITGIVQDENGFMWFATRKGLYRYNGYSYKLFRNNKKDSLSIPYNDIAYIYYDNQNNLWLRHYDELAAFCDENTIYSFDSITKNKYDIEVKIVQDKYNNYWIGPTGSGLLMYNPETKISRKFTCPPPTYTDESWHYFDSIINRDEGVACIENPGNNTNSAFSFSVYEDGYYLIASSGEIDKYGKYDYGSLYHGNNKIWEISNSSMWSGANLKNRFEVKPILLKKGKYSMRFKSDMAHSCANWEGDAPNKINFFGIKMVKINDQEFKKISSHLEISKDSNYIPTNKIKDILIDKDGKIWLLTDLGLEKYNYKAKSFNTYPIAFKDVFGVGMESEYMNLYQDSKGKFWIGSMYGILMHDHLWGRNLLFQNSKDVKVLTSNSIYSIFEDSKGKIWIGTDNGINIYDTERKTIEKIQSNNKNRLYDNRIIQIFEDDSKNVWVATFEGLNRLIKNHFTYTDLNYNAVHSFPAHHDTYANIWYTLENRIFRYSRILTINEEYYLPDDIFSTDDFTGALNYSVSDMTPSNKDHLWIATDNKVSRFDINTKNIDFSYNTGAIIVGNDSIKDRVSHLLYSPLNNKIIAMSPKGVFSFNDTTTSIRTFSPFPINTDFIDEIDLNFVKNTRKYNDSIILIRTSDGIYMYDNIEHKLSLSYDFDYKIKGGPLSKGDMDIDHHGNIWFSALPGLYKIIPELDSVEVFTCPFEHDWSSSNVKIGNNNIWIYGANGVYAFSKENHEFKHISIDNGIIDNNINGIFEDSLGYIWFTSLKGLSKYDINENQSKNFFTSADFTTHRFLGNPHQFDIPSNEEVLFTTNGIVSFYPDSINRNIPKIVIDKFQIRGKDFPLDSLVYYKRNINLKYNQNFIGIEFAVLDYTDPSENQYRYMLEGLDEEWNYTDASNRRANYSGIPPGKYIFKVQGSNNDKIWNEKGIEVNITITPPWYKTILAYILYAILIVGSIFYFIRARERKLIEEKHILETKVKERTREIEKQKEELAHKNKDILDSLRYAKRIQHAILPSLEKNTSELSDHFLLWRPQNIVSGDYHWSARVDNLTLIVAADCTGHGVPGAFMSMLGVAFLNDIVNNKKIVEPDQILNRLRTQIIRQLSQEVEEGEDGAKDGMDLSLYVIQHNEMKLMYSGAYNPLYIIRNSELTELKADKMPIGNHIKGDQPFTTKEYMLEKGDCLYNFSDGYPDQFGGEKGRKFMTKNFKLLLSEISQLPMCEQREILNTRIEEWMGDEEQIDDIIVIGVKV